MEQRANTSAAGNVGKKLLMAAILGAGLVLTGTIQAAAHPGTPPPRFARPGPPPVVVYQPPPVIRVVKTPLRYDYRFMPPRHHDYRPMPPPRRPLFFWLWR